MLARCIQHETDHLDGVLFLDRLTPETRKQAMKEIRQADWFDGGVPRDQAEPASAVRWRTLRCGWFSRVRPRSRSRHCGR